MQESVMKKIVVTSKRKFPELVDWARGTGEPWAYISIEGTDDLVKAGLISDNIHYLPDGPDTLNLNFDDTDKYEERQWKGEVYQIFPISESQAKEILEFGEAHKDHNLLIHCYAGRSRSVAIAQGLIDVYPDTWEVDEKSNPLLTPNILVLSLLHKFGLYM